MAITELTVWCENDKGKKIKTGILRQTGPSEFQFTYCDGEQVPELSPLMPKSEKSFTLDYLFPIFQMNLPEGLLDHEIRKHLAKHDRQDWIGELDILAFTGAKQIGRLSYSIPTSDGERFVVSDSSLRRDEFNLVDDELGQFRKKLQQHLRSGVSGMQPKFLASISDDYLSENSRTAVGEDYIIKTADPDRFPCLTVVESACMEMARQCGLKVADTDLSRQGHILFVKRFDVEEGRHLHFEESITLLGKKTADKYSGNYSDIAQVMEDLHVSYEDRKEFFRQLVFNMLIRNGDAHLKNFGIIFRNGKATLAPAYDLVSTRVYMHDRPALMVGKTSNWPGDGALAKFATDYLDIPRDEAKQIINNMRERLLAVYEQVIDNHESKYGGMRHIHEVMTNLRASIQVGTGIIKDKDIDRRNVEFYNLQKLIEKDKEALMFANVGIKCQP